MTKQDIRQEIKVLCSQHADELAEKSAFICQKIITSKEYITANEVFAYMALKDEVNLGLVILDALKKGKKVAVPKIMSMKDGIIKFFYLDNSKKINDQTATGTFGISEPDESLPAIPVPSVKTLILVPGRAFTKDGDRLGRGKGFYDRFLSDGLLRSARNDKARNDITLAGVCFDFQIKKSLPTSDRDIKMDILFS